MLDGWMVRWLDEYGTHGTYGTYVIVFNDL